MQNDQNQQLPTMSTANYDRVSPYDFVAEQAALGSLLIDNPIGKVNMEGMGLRRNIRKEEKIGGKKNESVG